MDSLAEWVTAKAEQRVQPRPNGISLKQKIKTTGKKTGLKVHKLSAFLARPEGFEPPTPRSVVLSNPQRHVLTWNRTHVFPSLFNFSFHLVSSDCGSVWKHPWKQSRRECGRLNDFKRRGWDARKSRIPLRYLLCVHQKSLSFSAAYPALFPQCFHGDKTEGGANCGDNSSAAIPHRTRAVILMVRNAHVCSKVVARTITHITCNASGDNSGWQPVGTWKAP